MSEQAPTSINRDNVGKRVTSGRDDFLRKFLTMNLTNFEPLYARRLRASNDSLLLRHLKGIGKGHLPFRPKDLRLKKSILGFWIGPGGNTMPHTRTLPFPWPVTQQFSLKYSSALIVLPLLNLIIYGLPDKHDFDARPAATWASEAFLLSSRKRSQI